MFDASSNAGGCPKEYDPSNRYEAGDKVTIEQNKVQKIIYECGSYLVSGYCDQYEPGHWSKLGWKIVGYCEGRTNNKNVMVPTLVPEVFI